MGKDSNKPIKFGDQPANVGKCGEEDRNAEEGEEDTKCLAPCIAGMGIAPSNGGAQFKGIKQGTMEWLCANAGINPTEDEGAKEKPKKCGRNYGQMGQGTEECLGKGNDGKYIEFI
jgi:hypothetical protein